MADFDNIFDAAITRADDVIVDAMGTPARVMTGSLKGKTIVGVFDDPDSTGYPVSGVRVEGTSPTLFVKSAEVVGVRRSDSLTINGHTYWIDRVGADDLGSCHLWLGTGAPPMSNRRR